MPARRSGVPALALGWGCLALFLGLVPLANWMIGHLGTACLPRGPCVVPVAPALGAAGPLLAPSGVLTVGLALVARDGVQRGLGARWGLLAVGGGAALSALVAPGALVLASAAAFGLSELADFAVYTPLQRRGLLLAVLAAGLAGLVVDSVVFLLLAFGTLDFLPGQLVGKAWSLLAGMPLVRVMRRLAPFPA